MSVIQIMVPRRLNIWRRSLVIITSTRMHPSSRHSGIPTTSVSSLKTKVCFQHCNNLVWLLTIHPFNQATSYSTVINGDRPFVDRPILIIKSRLPKYSRVLFVLRSLEIITGFSMYLYVSIPVATLFVDLCTGCSEIVLECINVYTYIQSGSVAIISILAAQARHLDCPLLRSAGYHRHRGWSTSSRLKDLPYSIIDAVIHKGNEKSWFEYVSIHRLHTHIRNSL